MSGKPASLLALDPSNQFSGMTTADADQYFADHPGAAPGGTGDTGLLPDDAKGYSDLVNLRTAYTQAKNPQATVRTLDGGDPLSSVASIANNPGWWTAGGVMQGDAPNQEAANELAMPASLRSLYRKSQQQPGS